MSPSVVIEKGAIEWEECLVSLSLELPFFFFFFSFFFVVFFFTLRQARLSLFFPSVLPFFLRYHRFGHGAHKLTTTHSGFTNDKNSSSLNSSTKLTLACCFHPLFPCTSFSITNFSPHLTLVSDRWLPVQEYMDEKYSRGWEISSCYTYLPILGRSPLCRNTIIGSEVFGWVGEFFLINI